MIMPQIASVAPRTPADTLVMCRKMYGDAVVLDALTAADGNVRDANRMLHATRQREQRGTKRFARSALRTNMLIYEGPVEIGPRLRAVIAGGRKVKSGMTRRPLVRSTFVGALTGLPADNYDSDGGNHIVIYDPRIGDGLVYTCEVVWTGQDYRMHCWRRSPLDGRAPITLEVSDAVGA